MVELKSWTWWWFTCVKFYLTGGLLWFIRTESDGKVRSSVYTCYERLIHKIIRCCCVSSWFKASVIMCEIIIARTGPVVRFNDRVLNLSHWHHIELAFAGMMHALHWIICNMQFHLFMRVNQQTVQTCGIINIDDSNLSGLYRDTKSLCIRQVFRSHFHFQPTSQSAPYTHSAQPCPYSRVWFLL